MSRLCIVGGRVIDPASGLDATRDVVVEGGRVVALCRVGAASARARSDDEVLDVSGLWVLPGLVDPHTHLREPGMTRAESVASGTRAAAGGGFTTVVCMPNTRPPLDDPRVLRRLGAGIRLRARVKVLPAAALSVGLRGERPTDVAALVDAGAAAFSDDGVGTRRASVLAEVLRRAGERGLPVLVHAEDHRLSAGGVMRAGPVARRLGLPGISAAAERVRVERDLRVLERAGGRLHLQHLSTASAAAAVRRAKRAGSTVTCEVTPHHLFLCDEDVEASCGAQGPDPDLKMNPPLGRPADRQALREALADGTIDALATDHAPHAPSDKSGGFVAAPFGVIGLETSLPLALRLVEEGVVDLSRAIALLTAGPARVLGIAAGGLSLGSPADIAVVDPHRTWQVERAALLSRSRNTPFIGWTMRGRVVYTLVNGQLVYQLDSSGRSSREAT